MPFNARKFVTAHISRAGHEYKVGAVVEVARMGYGIQKP